MTQGQQPEALRRAAALMRNVATRSASLGQTVLDASSALLGAADSIERLHAEHAALQAGYDAARLEIESLKSRLEPAGEYPPLPDFDAAEQYIYGACRRYITRDMLKPIHCLLLDYVDADRAMRAQPAPVAQGDAQPMQPSDDDVICPSCSHQFRAIPVNVQKLMLDAGIAPPFTSSAQKDVAMDTFQKNGIAWAVDRWKSEVMNRPMRNLHRRSLDDAWRQVVRYFGGCPDTLLGPCHDAARAQAKEGA